MRIINESRGLIVWDDLEALSARREKSAFGDLQQMLKLSYKKKTSRKSIAAPNRQSDSFDFYGPKVINNTGGVDQILKSRMLTVRTARLPLENRGDLNLNGSDPDFTFALRNELHIWGMVAASGVRSEYQNIMLETRGDRQNEILAPLKAIARQTGDDDFLNRLENACRREIQIEQSPPNPAQLLEAALRKSISEGFTDEIALPHLQLQISLVASLNPSWLISMQAPFWKDPQWIGQAIKPFRKKHKGNKLYRRRLYGVVTRIYYISDHYVNEGVEALPVKQKSVPQKRKKPFDFCLPRRCVDCEFVNVCKETVPQLMSRKKDRQKIFE